MVFLLPSMSNILAPEPFPLSRFLMCDRQAWQNSRQQQIFFCLFIPEREDKLHGVLGNSQNQWERDTNMTLSCPPVASAVTALWHSHCSVVCCCIDSKVWKYPISVDILGVAKIFPRRLSQLRKWLFFSLPPTCLYLNKTCVGFHGTKNRSTLRDSCSHF